MKPGSLPLISSEVGGFCFSQNSFALRLCSSCRRVHTIYMSNTAKINRINNFIAEDTAAAILAETEGRYSDAAVLWCVVGNLTARRNGLTA
jgi:hypothetical protein